MVYRVVLDVMHELVLPNANRRDSNFSMKGNRGGGGGEMSEEIRDAVGKHVFCPSSSPSPSLSVCLSVC